MTMQSSDQKKTIIEDGTTFTGTLSATGPVLARGHIDGGVSGPALEVTETGVVSGKIKVTELRSRGELGGRFEAENVILSGRIRDETLIVASSLEVASSSVLTLENCELRIGEPPTKEEALRAALAVPDPSATA